MERKAGLLSQFVVPLVALGVLLGAFVFWALTMQQQQMLERELRERAYMLAGELEVVSSRFRSASELIEHVQQLGTVSYGLQDLHVVEVSEHLVVASTNWAAAKNLPVFAGRSQWPEGNERSFAVPIRTDPYGALAGYGRDFQIVVTMDGTALAARHSEQLRNLLLISSLAAGIFFASVLLLFRRLVLTPISRVQSAVETSRTTGRWRMPNLHPDELGQLSRLLDASGRRLADQERYVRSMFDSLSGCAYRVDAVNKRVVFSSGGLESLLGKSEPEWDDFFDPEDRTTRAQFEGCASGGELWNLEYAITRDNRTVWLAHRGRALYGLDGKATFYDGLILDITERKERENQLVLMSEALQNSNNEVFILDSDSLGIVYANKAAYENLGYTEQEALSLTAYDVAYELRDEGTLAELLEQLETANEIHHRYTHTRKDGSTYPFDYTAIPVQNQNTSWLIVLGSDVSEKQAREEAVRRSEERLSLALEGTDYGIFDFDVLRNEMYLSPGVRAWLGLGEDEDITFDAVIERVNRDDLRAANEQLLRRQRNVASIGIELRVDPLGDGKILWLSLRGRGVYSDTGELERLSGFASDITRRKTAEDQLHAAIDDAQAATRAKGEFLATMSHEIRTPMNGVLGMTQLLLDMNLTREQRETAQVVFSSAESLLTIINDILDFSKIEAGKLEFEAMPFDLRSALREVMDLLANGANEKGLDLYVDCADDVPHHFVGDVGRVRQVLINLIGNAIKFTRTGHVLVELEWHEDKLRCWVRDTGLGIEADAKDSLFDSFTQADASTTRRFGGTGLGLAICKQLVLLMGGEIGVESEPGRGSDFWFTLDLPVGDLGAGRAMDTVTLDGVRILVVDDNAVGRRIFERMLASHGARVVCAEAGAEALTLLQTQAFDLAVLDYQMPEMDGLEVVRRIASDESLSALKVLMLSSSDVSKNPRVALHALKPVMKDSLVRMCAQALQRLPEESAAHERVIESVAGTGEKLRVLLAEDNAVNQKVAVRMLEKLGCTVDVAANGAEAVEMWSRFPYSMIFMDCQMPELDGLSATRRIRDREDARNDEADAGSHSGSRVPIVAMTANAMEQDREDCLAAGMDDYTSKPVNLAQLAGVLERFAVGRVGASRP